MTLVRARSSFSCLVSVLLAGAAPTLVGACSSSEEPQASAGRGGVANNAAGTSGSPAAGKGNATAGTSAGGSVGSGGTGTAGSSAGSGGSTVGGAGSSASGAGQAGAGGAGGGGGGTSGGGGSAGGTGGDSAAGGSSAGSLSAGGAGAAGAGAAGGAAGAGGGAGGAAPEACPVDASFCSGFDSAELPEGAVFKLNGNPATPWTDYFAIDTTVKHNGNSSLRTKSEINGYRMLAVPSGGATFWVRLYIRSDEDLGEIDHNVFAQAAKNDDPNDGEHMEFAEDVGLSLHFDDGNIRWPDGFGRLSGGGTVPYTLPKDTWHCLEFLFDGQGRVHQMYVAGTLLIDAQGFPANTQAWSHFKFGYNALHGTVRNTWYDDVAVAPARVGCLEP